MEIVLIAGIGIVILFILFKIFKAFVKWIVILLVIFFVVSYFTNPEESAHRQGLKEVVKKLPVKRVKEKSVEVDDYKFFSLTKVTVGGEKKVVGIGAFGKVWYFDDIEAKLKK